jgi:riboflavin kinase
LDSEENMCNNIFKASVFSGKKEGEFFVSIYAKNFEIALGFIPYPGTLNAKLLSNFEEFDQCILKTKSIVVDPPKIPGMKLGKVIAYPIFLFNSIKAYVVRPEITIYRKDIVEIISDKKLRDELNLVDGSIIDISLQEEELL